MIEQGLQERFQEPEGWLWSEFTGARGKALRFGTLRTHRTPFAHIVYIEGLSEYAELTFELSRDFNARSYNFSVFDRHGQGKSPRHLPNAHKQHSDGFGKDVADILTFCRDHIPAREPIVLLGHSTGGLLALMALHRAPELFDAAILTAPLFGFMDKLVGGRETIVGWLPLPRQIREHYIPGGADWVPRNGSGALFTPEDFSSDSARNRVTDAWQQYDPALRTGSPTLGWVHNVCRHLAVVRNPHYLRQIRKPVLIITAGGDKLVSNEATHGLVSHLRRGELQHYSDARHEILTENDSIRSEVLGRIDEFLKHSL